MLLRVHICSNVERDLSTEQKKSYCKTKCLLTCIVEPPPALSYLPIWLLFFLMSGGHLKKKMQCNVLKQTEGKVRADEILSEREL